MEPLSILFIGDPHFTVQNSKETNALHQEIVRVVNEIKPHAVIILGDTLDRHGTVDLNVLGRVKNMFDDLQHVPLYVLIGNHDIPNNRLFMSKIHPFMCWSRHNLTVVDTVTPITLKNRKFLLVPYVPPGRFQEAIQGYNIDELTCVVAHQEFKGCNYGKGTTSTVGDNWPYKTLVISGHIHERQRVGDYILYPGTPYQTNMGENPDKSISLFTWIDDKQYTEKLYTLNVPRKITLDMTVEQLRIWSVPDNINRYRINLHGNNAEFVALTKQGLIKNLTQQGVKVVFKDTGTKEETTIKPRERCNFHQGLMRALQEEQDTSIRDSLVKLAEQLFGKVQG